MVSSIKHLLANIALEKIRHTVLFSPSPVSPLSVPPPYTPFFFSCSSFPFFLDALQLLSCVSFSSSILHSVPFLNHLKVIFSFNLLCFPSQRHTPNHGVIVEPDLYSAVPTFTDSAFEGHYVPKSR